MVLSLSCTESMLFSSLFSFLLELPSTSPKLSSYFRFVALGGEAMDPGRSLLNDKGSAFDGGLLDILTVVPQSDYPVDRDPWYVNRDLNTETCKCFVNKILSLFVARG